MTAQQTKKLFWATSHSAILTKIDFSSGHKAQQAAVQVTNYHFLANLCNLYIYIYIYLYCNLKCTMRNTKLKQNWSFRDTPCICSTGYEVQLRTYASLIPYRSFRCCLSTSKSRHPWDAVIHSWSTVVSTGTLPNRTSSSSSSSSSST